MRPVHTRGRKDRGLRFAVGAGLLVLLAGLVWLAVVLLTQGVARAASWASVFGTSLAIALALVTLVTWRSGQPPAVGQPARSDQLDQAVTDLAEVVHHQWRQEAAVRSLRRREPIRIRLSRTARPVAAVLPEDVVPGRPEPAEQRDHDVPHVLTLFRTLQARQLVVLGAPGAGKTVLALLFTLSLLDSLVPGEPVPVLLSASSWDPRTEHLHTWLARRILEEYPALANQDRYGPNAAEQMVIQERVMAVLDGLDEMPAALLPQAIAALDTAVTNEKYPLVVTCRGDEYETAVRRSGETLTRATVLEIEPVELDDAAAFLMATGPSAPDRWRPVLDQLRVQPDRPLAQALTNPLMVSLARTGYAAPASDHPNQLLDLPDQAAVEYHLLEEFIPAAYQDSPSPPGTPSTSAQKQYSPDQALRWLTFLARHCDTGDLAWWQLVDTIPRSTRGISVGLPLGVLVGFMNVGFMNVLAGMGVIHTTHRFEGLLYALYGGSLSGLVTGLAYGVRQRPEPVQIEMRFRGTLVPFLRWLVLGLALGVGVGSGCGLPLGWVLAVGVVFGCALATPVWLDIPAEVAKVSSPGVVLQQDRTAAYAFSLVAALPFGLAEGLLVRFPPGLAFGVIGGGGAILVRGLMGSLAAGIVGGRAYGRVGGFIFALTNAVGGGLVLALTNAVGGGLAFELSHPGSHEILGVILGLAVGLIVGGLGVLSRAWGVYTLSRIWLALRGELPWRLMRFLEDAHRREVLRQSGATYQFRHARVQEHLAHSDPSTQKSLPTPSS
ncbi:MAG: NACHT domain-containing protein [Pseudonocardiales bacterium]|nr:NACHT domain-containing protein [Pseudonocardiales bacterium]